MKISNADYLSNFLIFKAEKGTNCCSKYIMVARSICERSDLNTISLQRQS